MATSTEFCPRCGYPRTRCTCRAPMTASEILARNEEARVRRHNELFELGLRHLNKVLPAVQPARTQLTSDEFHVLLHDLRAIDPFGRNWYTEMSAILKKHIEVKP